MKFKSMDLPSPLVIVEFWMMIPVERYVSQPSVFFSKFWLLETEYRRMSVYTTSLEFAMMLCQNGDAVRLRSEMEPPSRPTVANRMGRLVLFFAAKAFHQV